jgi:hypothetical protein
MGLQWLCRFVGVALLASSPGIVSASVYGFLGNFDVVNDTGKTAHGFEIELEGLHSSDITDTFGGDNRGFPMGRGFDPASAVVRYGAPTITEYVNGGVFGTKVTYMGIFQDGAWDFGTPSGDFITPGDNCWTGGGVGYGAGTPCDHFGVGTSKNATKTTYNWLVETAEPGVLSNGLVTLPAPVWDIVPAPVAGDPPVVAAIVEAPLPESEELFGEALWVKVFTHEFEDGVVLEDLVGGDPHVLAAETEIEWQLLQYDPGNPASALLEAGYGAPIGPNAASILRRYEFYAYAGLYDDETHEALVGSDSHPEDFEIGTYLGAQNAAANLAVAPIPLPPTLLLFAPAMFGMLRVRRQDPTRASRPD